MPLPEQFFQEGPRVTAASKMPPNEQVYFALSTKEIFSQLNSEAQENPIGSLISILFQIGIKSTNFLKAEKSKPLPLNQIRNSFANTHLGRNTNEFSTANEITRYLHNLSVNNKLSPEQKTAFEDANAIVKTAQTGLNTIILNKQQFGVRR
jgi:hypothetical protein